MNFWNRTGNGQSELDLLMAHFITLDVHSRDELKQTVMELLKSNHESEVLDRHNTNSMLFIFTADGERYGLKIEYGTAQVTRDEAHWYELAPAELKRHHVASHLGQDYAFVVLKWLQHAETLEEVAITHEGTDSQITMDYIIKILDQDRQLLAANNRISLFTDKGSSFFLFKYQKSAEQAAILYPYLAELLHQENITVNGKNLPGPDRFIQAVQQDDKLRDYLSPDTAGLIHGDTHADNLLVQDGEIYMIDPNGLDHIPIEYDYGRILWSMYGWNAIVRGEFTLVEDDKGYVLDIVRRSQYLEGFPRLREYFTAQEYHRAMYSAAVQFMTRVLHGGDSQEAKALYLRGLEVFAELFEELGVQA